jgi:hypothetical protein
MDVRRLSSCPLSPKDAVNSAGQLQDAIHHNAGKPTPSDATPKKYTIFTVGNPGDAIGDEVGKPTPSVATPPQNAFLAQMGEGTQKGTE